VDQRGQLLVEEQKVVHLDLDRTTTLTLPEEAHNAGEAVPPPAISIVKIRYLS
jgi:hypothetical protein